MVGGDDGVLIRTSCLPFLPSLGCLVYPSLSFLVLPVWFLYPLCPSMHSCHSSPCHIIISCHVLSCPDLSCLICPSLPTSRCPSLPFSFLSCAVEGKNWWLGVTGETRPSLNVHNILPFLSHPIPTNPLPSSPYPKLFYLAQTHLLYSALPQQPLTFLPWTNPPVFCIALPALFCLVSPIPCFTLTHARLHPLLFRQQQ